MRCKFSYDYGDQRKGNWLRILYYVRTKCIDTLIKSSLGLIIHHVKISYVVIIILFWYHAWPQWQVEAIVKASHSSFHHYSWNCGSNGMGLGKVGSPFKILKQNNKEIPKEKFQSSSSTWFNLQNDCPSANLWPNFS